MRPIKFRAWDKERREMRQSHNLLIGTYDGAIYWQFGYGEPEIMSRDNFDIMQFTGLLDKNGKEIYEGDIVYWKGPTENEFRGEIYFSARGRWERGHMGEIIDGDSCFLDNYDGPTIYEVIGNIHENPELLK